MNRFKFARIDNHITKSTARQSGVFRPIIRADYIFRLDDVLDKRRKASEFIRSQLTDVDMGIEAVFEKINLMQKNFS